MKSPWLTLCVIVASAFLWIAPAKPDVPEKATSKPDAGDKVIRKQAGQVRNDNDLKMKLMWCPPGEFMMGTPKSEKQRRKNEDQASVTLTTGFWLGKYEVTHSEWTQVMQTEPWTGHTYAREGADYPATWVSWNDATEFCRKLTVREREAGRLPDEWEYALPTEAQWEYACRARSVTRFSFGDNASKIGEYAWFFGNAWHAGEIYSHSYEVGQKKPNTWGLCDMHGNVWEWCRDVYFWKLPGGRDPEVKVNPDEKSKAPSRVMRGGCWLTDAEFARSGYRSASEQNYRDECYGFRVALSAVQPVE
jgi:formylglycine-generating enzyme required for sulfatase activity